jgi:hypothetical protein
MLNPTQPDSVFQVSFTYNQLIFLKQLLERVDIRGGEAPAFVNLVEAIRAASSSNQNTTSTQEAK